jgi:RNA polymerase sigma factor (sigma-70 family)
MPTIFGRVVRLYRWMEDLLSVGVDGFERRAEQDRRIADAIQREGRLLLRFIRRRVKDQGDAEDILQDVFYEFTEAYRLMKPIEQAGAWLYRVARNRIIDRFRKKKPENFSDLSSGVDDGERLPFEDLLPSPGAGPDAAYARSVLLEELEAALAELPEEQRAVFVAHEMEGRSFHELARESGLKVNTLLARKRYAVLHLRRRLQRIHEELKRL